MSLAMFIGRINGDPEKLEAAYMSEMTELAGLPGRGEEWGVPLAVILHICGFSEDAMYQVNVFEDESTMRNLVFAPQDLPPQLIPSIPDGFDALTSDVTSFATRWDSEDVEVFRVGSVQPPLRAVMCEDGGVRRARF